MDLKKPKMVKCLEKNYSNPKSSKIREFIRIYFLSSPLWKTKKFKDKVLDLGCGWGFYFKINPSAYGIDLDERCIKHLKSLGHRVIKEDIRKRLLFKDNFFKRVIAHDVLEHFELNEVEKIFLQVHQVLEPNGSFLILTPNRKGYDFGCKLNRGHKHFITFQEILFMAKEKFALQKHFFYPLPKIIGDYFTHNKEVIILKKI